MEQCLGWTYAATLLHGMLCCMMLHHVQGQNCYSIYVTAVTFEEISTSTGFEPMNSLFLSSSATNSESICICFIVVVVVKPTKPQGKTVEGKKLNAFS